MASEFDRTLGQIERSLSSLTDALDSVRRELSDDKIDLKGLSVRLIGLETNVEKLKRVTIEGNGAESLKSSVGNLNRISATLTRRLRSLEEEIHDRDEDARKARVTYITTLIAAAASVIVTLLNILYAGSQKQ